jgi:ATP-dependent exoDNAse (exonuclease V) beta subunit
VDLNDKFERIFAEDDGSGIDFSPSEPQRTNPSPIDPSLSLHLAFVPHVAPFKPASPETRVSREQAQQQQIQQIVSLIQSHVQRIADLRETFKAKKEKYRVAVLARVKKSLAPIAEALRNAHIPFRAIELEGLADRPEILDALALARALLQPQDRVAWLGVLRAPWCGLSLADLNTLAGTSDSAEDDRTARTIPDLLAERIHLLSPEARPAADRVLRAITLAPTLRAAQPTAALGTWLQQVWLSLGGDATVDAIARANVDLFFARLDLLPNSDSDLIGPALDAALKDLNALPNPEADADFGVQLMTIHKSKGLEFEVVLVPDLQLEDRKAHRSMLSWLERGLPPDIGAEATGEVTEFLIAPIQSKGSKRGSVKELVDQARRLREQQETRRILYVAATRARDELHLLARPNYKVEANGELSLIEPSTGLLATAWPALEEQTRARFDEWKSTRKATAASNTEFNAEIESLAASAGDLIVLPSTAPPAAKPTLLRRLPADYAPTQMFGAQLRVPQVSHLGPGKAPLYTRHEGGLLSRALGTAVHALLEELARLRATDDWHTVRASLKQHEPRIAAQVRAAGIAPQQSAQVAANALQIVLSASQDPLGQWILSAHPEADNEVRWAGVVAGTLTNVRVDRVFRAGLIPQSDGHAAWWIVDYKTAYDDNLDPTSALTQWRPRFAPQLETYAKVLRNLHGADAAIRAGLYYTRMSLLDWWEL